MDLLRDGALKSTWLQSRIHHVHTQTVLSTFIHGFCHFWSNFHNDIDVNEVKILLSISISIYKYEEPVNHAMSDTSNPTPTDTQETPKTEVKPTTTATDNTPPAVVVPNPAVPETSDSLEKLLEHIATLQQSNSALESAIQNVREGNRAKLQSNINEKIKPWIDSLDIQDTFKSDFLRGIETACTEGPDKTISDFETNPVYTVVCSAAAAHGTAIASLEATRQQLQKTEENMSTSKAQVEENIRNKTDALLYASRSNNKRTAEQISKSEEPDMSANDVWSTMFTAMRNTNGRFN